MVMPSATLVTHFVAYQLLVLSLPCKLDTIYLKLMLQAQAGTFELLIEQWVMLHLLTLDCPAVL